MDSVRSLEFAPHGEVHPSPRNWRDQFIYFLLIDRFDDGADDTPPFDPTAPRSPLDPGQGTVFQGGNLRGVARRLDYIRDLGCTAIWLSPVFKNRQNDPHAYHGYGIQDFLEVDPRFGSLEDLRDLVRQAHARGLYVILDVILNHTGNNWGYPGDLPYNYWDGAAGPYPFGFWREVDPGPGFQADDAVWPEELRLPECYKRRGQIRSWDVRREALDGDFLDLKELDLVRPDVLDTLIKVYKYWIAATDVDGFRVDTVKHMESTATALFCNAVREYARRIGKDNFFLFGEIVGDDRLIEHYLGRNARIDGTDERFPSLDAALDFPLYFVLEESIKGLRDLAALRERYDRLRTAYADHGAAGERFVTFVDNHDQMVRPYRRFLHGDPFPAQTVQAIAYLLTSPGVPCLYYGTEQGFDGGGGDDAYVRECMFGGRWGAFGTTGMHFFDPSHAVYRAIRSIAAVRAEQPALRYGRHYFREISGNGRDFGPARRGPCTLAYSRILDSDEILVVMNLGVEPRNDAVTVDRNLSAPGRRMVDLLGGLEPLEVEEVSGRSSVRVPLAGHQVAILKAR